MDPILSTLFQKGLNGSKWDNQVLVGTHGFKWVHRGPKQGSKIGVQNYHELNWMAFKPRSPGSSLHYNDSVIQFIVKDPVCGQHTIWPTLLRQFRVTSNPLEMTFASITFSFWAGQSQPLLVSSCIPCVDDLDWLAPLEIGPPHSSKSNHVCSQFYIHLTSQQIMQFVRYILI